MPDWLVAVVLAEAAALMIALIVPVTPSKTGSTWSPAELFVPEPSYLQEVAAGFVIMHCLYLVIAAACWLRSRSRRDD